MPLCRITKGLEEEGRPARTHTLSCSVSYSLSDLGQVASPFCAVCDKDNQAELWLERFVLHLSVRTRPGMLERFGRVVMASGAKALWSARRPPNSPAGLPFQGKGESGQAVPVPGWRG